MDQIKQNNKVRSLMVGAISHDLRTPLNGIIINISEGLKDELGVSKHFKDTYLKPAMINCNILMSLINNILIYTKEKFN